MKNRENNASQLPVNIQLSEETNVQMLNKQEGGFGSSRKFNLISIKSLALSLGVLTLIGFTSCNSASDDLKDAQEEVTDAEKELDEAQKAYEDEVKAFRLETEEKISANELLILEWNKKIENGSTKMRAEYLIKMKELDDRNRSLKKKMIEYKADTKENWNEFKTEFNDDMSELGTALKNFTVDK
jgi:hypothetical protein